MWGIKCWAVVLGGIDWAAGSALPFALVCLPREVGEVDAVAYPLWWVIGAARAAWSRVVAVVVVLRVGISQ